MRYTAGAASGTVLWSVSLPASRETVVTHSGLGQGGCVGQGLPLPHGSGGFVRMCVLTFKALFRPPFQWREFILQSWFLFRVSFLPTLAVSAPLTVLL